MDTTIIDRPDKMLLALFVFKISKQYHGFSDKAKKGESQEKYGFFAGGKDFFSTWQLETVFAEHRVTGAEVQRY